MITRYTGDIEFSGWTVFKIGFEFGAGFLLAVGVVDLIGRLLNSI